jgi:hypothetical protein
VIYFYAGPDVASPALGSASPLVRKIGYGLALPSIIIAGVVNGSVACKYIYFRMWKGTNVIHQTNFKSVGSWVAICAVAWFVSWVISMAVPNFNMLLGLIVSDPTYRLPYHWLLTIHRNSLLYSAHGLVVRIAISHT